MRTKLLGVTRISKTFSIILILALPILSVRPVFVARIFEDGFESGNFNKWNPVVGSPSVTSGGAHHGTYKAVLNASGQYAQARFASVDHCFMRAYVLFKRFPNTGTETPILGVYNTSYVYMSEARVVNVSGTIKWKLRYYNNGVHYTVVSEQQKPVLNTWYCVEVEGKSNTATGAESRIYINGNELTDVSQTGKNNNYKINCAYIWESVTPAVTMWYDCVVVDTAYIGPERYLTVVSPYGTTGGQGWYNDSSTAHATLNTGAVDQGNGTLRVFTNWSGNATGTDYASSDPITMNANKTAVALWKTQYNVTFTCSGLDSSASGTVVTVNGVPVNYGELPYSIWADAGSTVTYSYSNVSSSTSGKRFILNSVSGPTSPITVTGPTSVNEDYKTQYQIDFDHTGVGSDFTGTIVTVDGTDYVYTQLPAAFWWDSGSSHTFSFASPLVTGSDKEYNWTSTIGLSTKQSDTLTITSSGGVTGNYGSLYQVKFDITGVAGDFSGTVVAIDGINYSSLELPASFWWAQGSTHTFTFQSPLEVAANAKQYAWTSTTGLSTLQSDMITVSGSGSVTGNYKTQYYLTIVSPYGTTGGQGWHDDGNIAYATLDTGSIDHGNGTGHVFTSWSGDSSGTNYAQSDPITMNGTKTATANWRTQYSVTFAQTGLDSSASGTVVTVNGWPKAYGDLPYQIWVDSSASVTYSYSNVSSSTTGKRFNLTDVAGPESPITVTGPTGTTGNYKIQYYLDVTSPYGAPTPASGWFDEGSSITSSVTSPEPGSAGTRYVCTGWTGTGSVPSSGTDTTVTFTITDYSSISWNWKIQYLLTVNTDPADLVPQPARDPTGDPESSNSWWYDVTPGVTLTAQTVAAYTFNNWTVDGNSQGNGVNPIAVTMNGPHIAIAHYSLSDITPPEITVISPQNRTYYSSMVPLEFKVNETTSWIGCSLDGQANVTISGNTTLTVGEGSHSVKVFASDTSGNIGSSNTVYFTARTGVIDIGVMNVKLSKDVVCQGYSMLVDVTVKNEGNYVETFNVTLYTNNTKINAQPVTLYSGENTTLAFTWDTTGFSIYEKYNMTATVDQMPGELHTADNTLSGGTVIISHLGDINGDGKVDIQDLARVSGGFATVRINDRNDPRYWQYWHPTSCKSCPHTPNADINNDGKIDIQDLARISGNYGWHIP